MEPGWAGGDGLGLPGHGGSLALRVLPVYSTSLRYAELRHWQSCSGAS